MGAVEGVVRTQRAGLETLRSVQVAAAIWERHGSDPGFLDHRGKRLAEASALSTTTSTPGD